MQNGLLPMDVFYLLAFVFFAGAAIYKFVMDDQAKIRKTLIALLMAVSCLLFYFKHELIGAILFVLVILMSVIFYKTAVNEQVEEIRKNPQKTKNPMLNLALFFLASFTVGILLKIFFETKQITINEIANVLISAAIFTAFYAYIYNRALNKNEK